MEAAGQRTRGAPEAVPAAFGLEVNKLLPMTLRSLHLCVTSNVFGSDLPPARSLQAALQTGPDAGSTLKGTVLATLVPLVWAVLFSVADHQV